MPSKVLGNEKIINVIILLLVSNKADKLEKKQSPNKDKAGFLFK